MKKVTNDIKSKVMKAAWTIFRKDTKKSWSEALKKAWAWAKKNLLRPDVVTILGDTLKFSAKAVLYSINGYQYWIPKSVIVEETAGGCILKAWFAEKNFGGSTWGICCHY